MAVSPVTLKTNLADYPATLALKDGRVTSDLVKLDYLGPQVANKAFKAMVRDNEYEAGELAIITYLQARAWGKPFVMLPAPISGRFQHHCIAFNQERAQLKPRDIEGRKVGVRTYSQTTGLWVRGILQHEYGVDLDKVTWMTIEDAHVAEYHDPANCQRLPGGSKLAEMMLSGELAAAILGGDMPKGDPRVQSLVPDPQNAAKDWYQREGVIPLNHVFVVREELSRTRPDVVREIYRMVLESRKLAGDAVTRLPFGLEANRKGLQLAIDWSFEQKIIPRRLTVDEPFDETTAALGA